MNINKSSIKNKFIGYFIVYVIVIFVVLWLLQIFFLQACYKLMLRYELIRIGNNIRESMENQDILDEISFKNSFSIILTDENGTVEYSSTTNARPFYYIDFSQAKNILNSSKRNYATYSISIPKISSGIMVYISKVQQHYIIVSTNIDPISPTTRVLATQLVYITVILLIISILVAITVSNKFAKPIESITKKAKELGKDNYDVEFETNTEYTELNNLAETLNYSAKELKKTDSLRKELIANVSHDIKTPLTIIKAYAEMIKDISGNDKEKREEHLNVIINQTDLLTKLADDMMDLSKLETRTDTLNLSDYNLIESIGNIIKGFECFNEYNFILSYNENENYMVRADEIKISQVLTNLISNAINYVGEDKSVYITLKKLDDKFMRVEVHDNGEGMDDTSHIFDRYYKSNDKFRKSGYGTGLGLSIVKNILDMHKFNYGVNSKKGEGTTFFFDVTSV